MPLSEYNIDLNLLDFSGHLETTHSDDGIKVWDPIRKKHILLQPEEHVRQLFIQYLIKKGWSKKLISVEKQIKLSSMVKRYDLVVYKTATQPFMLVECKRPNVEINQDVFDQISNYNIELNIPYLIVTNGHSSYACHVDFQTKEYTFIDYIPAPDQYNPMSELKWNYSEFLSFVLLHAAYADLDFSPEERKSIESKVGLETFEKISDIYDTMGEYERLKEIMKYKGVYFPTQDRKDEILSQIRELFDTDGEYSKLEKNLLNFLNKML